MARVEREPIVPFQPDRTPIFQSDALKSNAAKISAFAIGNLDEPKPNPDDFKFRWESSIGGEAIRATISILGKKPGK